MESFPHSRQLFEHTADETEGQSSSTFAQRLRENARLVREGRQGEVRGEVSRIMAGLHQQQRQKVSADLEHAARDVQTVFKESSSPFLKLPDNNAAQAKLQSTEKRFDPRQLGSRDNALIDRNIAADVYEHELEHNRQSKRADAESVRIGNQTWTSEQLRERGAISVQKNIDFLSAEYRRIAQGLSMDSHGRDLIRQGRFRQFAAEQNGQLAQAA